MTVISIQSQVAFGHVGNSAAVFRCDARHRRDCRATTLLSNRPGYPTIRGRVLKRAGRRSAAGAERGALEAAKMICRAISARLTSPPSSRLSGGRQPPHLCSIAAIPCSEIATGLLVHADIPPLVRELCPLADIITPIISSSNFSAGRRPRQQIK